MKLEFPREDIPDHLVEPHYKMVMDMHMHYDKMHSRQEFTYIKYAGFFILAFLGFMLMEGKGLIGDYLIAVVCTGFGVLFASVMTTLFISSEIDWKRSIYEKEGKVLEERYPSIINFNYFKMISKLNPSRYRATLFLRLTPSIFVGILTIWSAVMLSMKTSLNLAITIGVASSFVLFATMGFLARKIKKCQLTYGLEKR
ncbi:hypothetical protein COB11_04315 [Candidatus Aerophobetes bacterium]|uniref:Uncharacterized protein n=1 Tax=Aerophobetes bacterium TaxID=2030807 RepID=A0A2A4YH12_UNCAE|nr:MAG: hypothetical protein COB11_04315 [Candidatus Aerophobetes bacterium]